MCEGLDRPVVGTRVVGMHVHVFCSPVPPLEAINGAWAIVPTVSQPAVHQIEERDETRRDQGGETVPKSPSSLWPSPHLARKSLDPFSFQMLTSVPGQRIPKEGKPPDLTYRSSCAEAHRTFGCQSVGIRAARHEPQELLGHPLPPHALSGEERKGAVPQAKPHLTPEPRESACASKRNGFVLERVSMCERARWSADRLTVMGEVSTNSRPVVSVVAMFDDRVHKPKVLLFFMRPNGLAAYIP
jgi:hypothetical protein